MPRRPAPRSLGDALRAWGAEELARLVTLRPDLARPVPPDVTALAARAATEPSCERALTRLDTAHLRALQCVAHGAADEKGVARMIGCTQAAARTWLGDLAALALVWRAAGGYVAVRAAAEPVRRLPTGLGPVRADPLPPAGIAAALARLTPPARAIRDQLAWEGPRGALASTGPHRAARDELLGARLLLPDGETLVRLPAEVGLHLRGGRLLRDPGLTRPAPAAPARAASDVDRAGGGAAGAHLATVTELVTAIGASAPRSLRTGGIGVRDLAALADGMGLDTVAAERALTLAHAAGLVAAERPGAGQPWAPTTRFDAWRRLADPERHAALAQAWWESAAGPRLVGSTPEEAPTTPTPVRQAALRALAGLPPGQPASATEVAAMLRWDAPLSGIGDDEALVAQAVAEATELGLVALGAATSAGRAIASGEDVAAAAGPHLPDPVEQVLLQADLTAVAPGPLVAEREAFLRACATLESRGGASVFRFSPSSVRRALDAGWSAEELLRRLAEASLTPVPQPLDYLVRDVARHHGVLRAGAAVSYLRSDDPGLLDQVMARRDTGVLRLERLAPTVAVASVPLATLLDVLREQGLAPAAEGQGASLGVPAPRRSPVPQLPRTRMDSLTEEQAQEVAARVLAGELRRDHPPTATPGPARRGDLPTAPRIPSLDPVVTLVTLQEAAATGDTVWLAVADALGATQQELVRVTRVAGGRVHGHQLATGLGRSWPVSRISGVAPA